MSYICVKSRALDGFESPSVAVEIDLIPGIPDSNFGFKLVGLPEVEVRESKERVRSAIFNSQLEFPIGNIVVNLAPADLPKESGRFDLPIALGILAANGVIPVNALDDYEFVGELSLSGALRPVRGALAMAWRSSNANKIFVLPYENAIEASLVEGAKVIAAKSLNEICAHLKNTRPLPFVNSEIRNLDNPVHYLDMSEVKGQTQAKRALQIAAAGYHNVIMVGPPGTGKSMLAQRVAGILPPMQTTEALESAAIQSLSQGILKIEQFRQRPYRAPHHTASAVALVGGGATPRPGEISLAHNGVIFLDELPEFDRKVLEVLREPIENGKIVISRALQKVEFPARFQLIAAMNPCPCGFYGHLQKECRCTPNQIEQYTRKISGPLLDRIDLSVEVPSLSSSELQNAQNSETSDTIRERVTRAHNRQIKRQGFANAHLSSKQLDKVCKLTVEGKTLMANAMDKLALSARAYYRILKVARTIADLEEREEVAINHISEAIQYRRSKLLNT